MLSATSFQITLLTGRNWQDSLQLYVLGGVFLAASAVWYPLFRLRPSVYVLSTPWLFFGIAFFLIGLPSAASAIHPAHHVLANVATWCYAVASAASFLFFGLNFGEEAVRFLFGSFVQGFSDFFRVPPRKFGRCARVLYRDHNKFGSRHFGIGVTR